MRQLELLKHTDQINELLARYGVKFGIYKNNAFKEQLLFSCEPPIRGCCNSQSAPGESCLLSGNNCIPLICGCLQW